MAVARQQTFSDVEYGNRKHTTRREKFLSLMEAAIDWEGWVQRIQPHYHSGRRGRPPRGIETMLRMYLLQEWYSLSAKGVEDAVNDSYAMRRFVGVNFLHEQVPDATTLLGFRRLMSQTGLAAQLSRELKLALKQQGVVLRRGRVEEAVAAKKNK